jgi:hypothetical protein
MSLMNGWHPEEEKNVFESPPTELEFDSTDAGSQEDVMGSAFPVRSVFFFICFLRNNPLAAHPALSHMWVLADAHDHEHAQEQVTREALPLSIALYQ